MSDVDAGGPAASQSFGGDAELYDRARPSYPTEAIDHLVDRAPERVVDVGCGTGILSRLLLARGCDVLGVEPDPRMASVARGHGVIVEASIFEEWDAAGRTFDLLVSGMAWHWVDPVAGAAKAGQVLREGAGFAALWNVFGLPEAVRSALLPCYQRHAPRLPETALVLSPSPELTGPDRDAEALLDSGWFTSPWREDIRWPHRYTTESWVAELATRSSHRTLPDGVRAALLEEVARAVDDLGGAFDVEYHTTLLRAVRDLTPVGGASRRRARPAAWRRFPRSSASPRRSSRS